jgi:hypothetical protein
MPNVNADGAHSVATYQTSDGASKVRIWNDTERPAPGTIRTSDGRTAVLRHIEEIRPGMVPELDDLRLEWPGLEDVLDLAAARWELLDANERSRFGDEFFIYAGDAMYQAERDGVPPVAVDLRVDA